VFTTYADENTSTNSTLMYVEGVDSFSVLPLP
jgi:hypothetical protein